MEYHLLKNKCKVGFKPKRLEITPAEYSSGNCINPDIPEKLEWFFHIPVLLSIYLSTAKKPPKKVILPHSLSIFFLAIYNL